MASLNFGAGLPNISDGAGVAPAPSSTDWRQAVAAPRKHRTARALVLVAVVGTVAAGGVAQAGAETAPPPVTPTATSSLTPMQSDSVAALATDTPSDTTSPTDSPTPSDTATPSDPPSPTATPTAPLPPTDPPTSAPARDLSPVIAAPTTYRVLGSPHRVPDSERPRFETRATRVDGGVHDVSGVRMARVGGVLYDHPAFQATYGIANINSYQQTHDPLYLSRALLQADRLKTRHVDHGGGWFFPYGFPAALPAHGIDERPPWYSEFAQGAALSLFSRLASLPALSDADRATWRAAADATFASFRVQPPGERNGITVDRNGYLWLQEWPTTVPDDSFGGHASAAYGIYDYWVLTGSSSAAKLWEGAAATLLHYAPVVRNVGWRSNYCATHSLPTPLDYQGHLVQHFMWYSWILRDPRFAHWADLFASDYPPMTSGSVHFSGGTYRLVRFSATGHVVASRSMTVKASATYHASNRAKIRNEVGFWFTMTTGPAAGWLVAESPSRDYLTGVHLLRHYDPARRMVLPWRVRVGYRFSGSGTPQGYRTVTRTADTPVTYDAWALMRGRYWVHLSSGPLAGYWIPDSGLYRP